MDDLDEEDTVVSHVLDLPPSPLPSKKPETSITSDHDGSVFRDIEAEIDEASDIVCNGGLDIGDMIEFVEHDETNDEEQRRIARFLTSGCSCKLLDGIPCSAQFIALLLQELVMNVDSLGNSSTWLLWVNSVRFVTGIH